MRSAKTLRRRSLNKPGSIPGSCNSDGFSILPVRYTPAAAAKLLGVSVGDVQFAIRKGTLAARWCGRRLLVLAPDLRAYAERRR